jgi:hypothetical protein
VRRFDFEEVIGWRRLKRRHYCFRVGLDGVIFGAGHHALREVKLRVKIDKKNALLVSMIKDSEDVSRDGGLPHASFHVHY